MTDHFLIWYDTRYATLRPLVGRLEGTYHAVARVSRSFGFAENVPAESLPIVLLDQQEDYARIARASGVDPAGAAGFYDPNLHVAIFANILNSASLQPVTERIQQLQNRQHGRQRAKRVRQELLSLVTRRAALVKRFNRLVIQHEAAHQILFSLGVHVTGADNPTWLVEGLATQFETSQTNVQGKLRHTNQWRLADLRTAAGVPRGVNQLSDALYARAFREGGLIPLAELIADEGVLAANNERVSTVYAESWALVFFLAREREKELTTYLAAVKHRAVGTPVTPEEELAKFAASFGPIDDMFQRAWLSYIIRLRVDPAGD